MPSVATASVDTTRTRAYALLTVKEIDDERRQISGVATTPEPDRAGDIVESNGITFKNPMPLLLFHDSRRPVGKATFERPTKDGIRFKATIAKIAEPGTLKDRVDEAWLSVKAGLIGGVSIGFRPIELSFMDDGGIHFLESEVLELSLVAIPANASAVIDTIKTLKSYDLDRPAIGTSVEATHTPAVVGTRATAVAARSRMKTTAEKKAAFVADKETKVARMKELMGGEDVTTLEPDQQDEFDNLTAEVEQIDKHLARLETFERFNKQAAVEVKGATQKEGSESRVPVVSVKSVLPPDLEFCRMVLCKAASYVEFMKGNIVSPVEIAKKRYPDNPLIQQYLIAKTAVAGGTTTDSNFASALLAPAQVLESAFLEYLRPRTIVGRFGTEGIPSLRRVPFNVKIQSQSTGAVGSWVGEGKPKPVVKFNTTSTTLLFTKIAAISVITEELARFSQPGAEGVVRDELAKAVIQRMDYDFIDPDKAVSSGVNPASITNGVTPKTSAGTSAANVLTDIQNLVAPFIVANYDVSDLVLIMPNSLALVVSLMQNSLGQDSFRGMTVRGGTLAGLPVIASQWAGNASSYGNMVICVSASNIALADDGNVTVDVSREASIEMSDAPGNDATSGTGASLVSMWQTNSIALRAEREINWKKLRSDAVTFMDDVNWGSIGSPA